MSWRSYLFLALMGVIVLLVVAAFQTAPGYMDAEYYYAGGLRLNGGYGFSEMILWNYLDGPQGLPHPSHAYWMPLASLLALAGMKALGSSAFWAGRLPFILIAACISPLTAALAYRFTPRRDAAFFAGLLAVFSAFYLPYLPTSDTFAVYMLLGTLWLWLAAGYTITIGRYRLEWGGYRIIAPLLLGLVSGLMHLARADGILWMWLACAVILLSPPRSGSSWKERIAWLSYCLGGYLLVMAPWMLRNLGAFGSLLAPGGLKALWFVDYNDLYLYPASLLTPERWWSSGWELIVRARFSALGTNLQSALAVQGGIFLMPLVLWGLWRLHGERLVRLAILIWLITLGVMSIIFPFAGARGGFFHSGAAFQPLFWACVPAGLDGFIAWGNRKRGWQVNQARRVFQSGLLVLACALTLIILTSRVLGADWRRPVWGSSTAQYERLEGKLQSLSAVQGDIVMVNNPPGYFLASGRPALAIPDGDESTLLAAAEHYGGNYILLEANHPQGLDDLYQHPGDRVGLRYLTSFAGVHYFAVSGE